MTRDDERIYILDPDLGDEIKWEQGRYTCFGCDFDFAYVRRQDREMACPRCGERKKWRVVLVDPN